MQRRGVLPRDTALAVCLQHLTLMRVCTCPAAHVQLQTASARACHC